jgi:hypothetical protein
MLDGIFNSISEKIKNFVSSIGQWWLHDNLPSWMIQKSSFGGAGGGDWTAGTGLTNASYVKGSDAEAIRSAFARLSLFERCTIDVFKRRRERLCWRPRNELRAVPIAPRRLIDRRF